MIFIEVSGYWDYDIISKLHFRWRGLELLTLTSQKASLFKWQIKYEISMNIRTAYYYRVIVFLILVSISIQTTQKFRYSVNTCDALLN